MARIYGSHNHRVTFGQSDSRYRINAFNTSCIPVVILLTLIFTTAVRAQTTYTWSGGGTGDWSVAANWTPVGVPGSGDTAIINNSTVTLGTTISIAILNLNNSFLELGADLTVSSAMSFNNSSRVIGIADGGATLTIPEGVQLSMDAGSRSLSGDLTLELQGTALLSAGTFTLTEPGLVTINNAGLFQVQGSGRTLGNTATFNATFNNTGTLRFDAEQGTAFLDRSLRLFNTGLIELTGGTLNINTGGFNLADTTQHTGTIRLGDQTSLVFNSGNHRIGETGVISGEGTLALTGGTFLNDGTISPGSSPGILNVTGNFPLSSPTSVLLIDVAGTQPGSDFDQLLVSGTASLGGNLSIRLDDSFQPESSQEFTVLQAGSVNNEFSSVQLTGNGSGIPVSATYTDTTVVVRFTPTDLLPPVAINDTAFTTSGTPVTVNVLANDSDPQGRPISITDVTQPDNGSSEITQDNQIRYTPNVGFTGTDQFDYTISNDAGLTASALVTVFVQESGGGETYTWVGGTGNWGTATNWDPEGVPGIGDTAIIPTGSITISNDITITNLSISATLIINETLTVTDSFTWTFGTLTGNGTLELPAQTVTNVTSGSNRTISGALTINQAGTFNWSSGIIAQNIHTGAINNSGLFDIQGDLTLGQGGPFGGNFNNTGTLRKSAGTGAADLNNSVRLSNTGVIEALSGTLIIRSGASDTGVELVHTGAFRIGDAAELRFAGGTHRIDETGVISGEGTLALTGGTFLNDGTISPGSSPGILNVTGNIPLSSPTSVLLIDVAGNQAGSEYDQLLVSGTANLGGDLSIRLDDSFQPEASQEFTVLRAGALNNEFSSVQLIDNGSGIPVSATYTDTTVVVRFTPTELLPPVALNDTALTTSGTPVTINVLANDSDPQGRPISITEVTQPGNGTTEITQGNQIRYTPADGFIGTDQFGYTISNNTGLTASALVTVFVQETGGGVTYTWAGGTGNWGTATNWDPVGVPGISDTAIIPSGSITVSNDVIISNLSLSATLTINESLTVQNTFNWTSGTLAGSGTLELSTQAVSNFTSVSIITISGAMTINQAGTVNWSGGNIRQENHSGAINNSGLFDIQGDLRMGDGFPFGGSFNNTGTLRKSAGTGEATLVTSVRLDNAGVIEVLSGTLSIQAGASNTGIELAHTGAFHIGPAAELRFTAGTHRITESGVISGPGGGPFTGVFSQSGGSLILDGELLSGGQVNLIAGSLTLNPSTTLPNLSLAAGTLTSNATLTVTDTFAWSGGTLAGSGTLELPAETVSNFTAGFMTISGAMTINQAGTLNWSGGSIRQENQSGAINNSGLIDIQGDLAMGEGFSFGGSFNNTGTLRKSSGTGAATLDRSVRFDNTGVIEVLSGTLTIRSGGLNTGLELAHSGTFRIGDAAELRFAGGTHRIDEAGVISGPDGEPFTGLFSQSGGSLILDGEMLSGGQVNLNGGTLTLNPTTTMPHLTIGGATLITTTTLTVTDSFTWTSGTLTGSGTLELPAQTVSNISTTSSKTISGTMSINHAGTLNWSGGQILQVAHTGEINNSGLLDMQGDLTLGTGNAFGGTLNNSGVFRKSAGTGTGFQVGFISSSVRLNNSGVIEALSGTLNIASGQFNTDTELAHSGAFHIGEAAELRFIGGTHRIDEAGVISGDGTLALTGGTFLNDGTISPGSSPGILNVTGNIPLSSPTSVLLIDVTGTQPGTEFDQLLVTGAADLGGNLSIRLDDSFQPESSQEFTVLRAGSVNNEFSNVQLTGNGLGIPVTTTYTDTTVVIRFSPVEPLPPVAVNDTAFTTGGNPVTINVLANDSDPQGRSISIAEVAQPGNGSVEIILGNQIRYTPADGFIGTDQFGYTISNDAGLTASALVTVFVVEVGEGVDYTWVGGTGNWNVATNWSPAGVPGINDRATVSTGSVTIDSPVAVQNLTLSSATLNLNAALTVTQTLTWNTNAVITGPQASVLTIPEGAQLLMNAGSRSVGGAFTLNLNGATLWSAGSIGQIQATGVVINNTGVFEMAGDLTLGTFNAFWATFNNSGVFRKSAGSENGLIEASIRLVNTGTLEVNSGTLQMRMGLFNAAETIQHGGTIVLADTASLAFIGGDHRFPEGGVISGPEGGPVRALISLSNASLTLQAPLELLSPFTTINSSLTLNRDYNFPELTLNNTTLNLNAALTVTQTLTWNNNARIIGPQTSVLTIPEGAQLLMNAGSRSLGGALTLDLNGTTLWTAGSIGQIQATGVVINNSGLFEMAGDLTLGTFNAFWATFNNTGVFRKSAGSENGLIEASIRLVNIGTLEVNSGTLQMRMGSFNAAETIQHGGTIVLADTAALAFIGGNHLLPEGGVISGPESGPVRALISLSNASLALQAPLELLSPFTTLNSSLTLNRDYSFPQLILNNTTLNLNAALTVTQTLTWNNNARITGPQTSVLTIPEGAQLLMNAGSRSLGGALTLNLNGTTLWTAGSIGHNQATGVVINNSGLFEMAGDLTLGTFNAFWATFNNTGVFRKSAGSENGLIEASIRLVNTGTLEVNSGSLQMRMGSFNAAETIQHGGTIVLADTAATLAIIGGNHRLTETGRISGSGTFALSGGTFQNDGTISPGLPIGLLNVTGNLPFSSSSARLEIGLGGDEPGTDQDQLIVSGAASLDGTLALQLADGFLPAPEQEFVVLRAAQVSGVFAEISQPNLGAERFFQAVYSDSTVALRFTGIPVTRPVAVDDSVSTPFNTAVVINVLANDISPNGDPLTIVSITQPGNGTAGITGDSLITYTPSTGFSGTDHFTYVISNSLEEVDSARVAVTVLEEVIINNPPVAVNDTVSTVLNLPVLVDVLANDSDPDGDPLAILGFDNPTEQGGSVALTLDERLQYTPPAGFTGTDRFRYSITDGRGGVDSALVVVDVFPVRFEVVLAGSPGTRAMAVDEDGTVAGNRIVAGSPVQGFFMNATTELVFNSGTFGSQIYGISGGVMTGIVMVNDTSGTAHRFNADGTADNLGTLGGTFSLGYSINAEGIVTGVSTDSLGRSRAFITGQNGEMSEPGTPGFQFSTGYAVNRDGVVAGMVSNPGGTQRAWINGQVVAEANSRAYSLNTAGDAAGSLESQGLIRAAYWRAGGETVVLPSGNEPFSEAYGINGSGWVAGVAGPNPPGFDSGSSISAVPGALPRSMAAPNEVTASIPDQHRAVVWISDTLFDLNELIDPTSGWTLLEAAAINSSGQIAGTGIHQGSLRAFLLSPVDEEPPLAIDLFGITSTGTELIIDLGSLNGEGVRVVQVGRPDHGTASIAGETSIRYIPSAGHPGSDRFRYTLSNGRSVSHGHITVTIEAGIELPERMLLGQNYPNPFNPGTVIPVFLPETTDVRLEVFDLLGRFVLDVFSGQLTAGEHHLTVDASRLSSGTYIYRLSSPAGVQTRKMTLLK